MGSFRKLLNIVAGVFIALALLAIVGFGLFSASLAIGLPLLIFIMIISGWLGYVYFRYRFTRQEELLQLLVAASEANLPLVPALRAYVRDRPTEGQWGWWDVAFLFAFPPAYWLMHQRYAWDRRAADVADALEEGSSLPEALRSVPGAAPYNLAVAAAVGESTGRLSECLRRADRERLVGVWLDVIPRLAYPIALVLFITGVTTFFLVQIMPRIKKIFDDFHEPLPNFTIGLVHAGMVVQDWWAAIAGGIALIVFVIALLIVSPAFRWYLPFFGRLYRWDIQGLVLRMLSPLTAAGRPIPESLLRLADAPDFPTVVQNRLRDAHRRIERGDGLAESLHSAGLLPQSMAPLVRAAERANTLPWALAELGEVQAGRASRVVRRTTLVIGIMMVIAVGTLVASIVLAMFLPLIKLLTSLSI
jgi:type IV pilus assembly protein PilC